MKRGNGTGSVYRLSGKRRKPWIAIVTMSRDEGKQQRMVVGTFCTKAEALTALSTPQHLIIHKNITFDDLYSQWSSTHFRGLSRSTTRGYDLSHSMLSSVHNEPFQELRTAHYQEIINTLEDNGKSYSTTSKIKGLLNLLYDYAMANDIIDKSYSEYIKLPPKSVKETTIFSDSELNMLYDNREKPWIDSILILCYSGYRINELLEMPVFSIKDGCFRGGSKTEAGKDRLVPIHPKITTLVQDRIKQSKGGYLLEYNGRKVSYKRYRGFYRDALESLGIDYRTIHSTRHTFATLCAKAGIKDTAAQQMMGHADYSTMANIYTHMEDAEYLRTQIAKIL